MKRLLVATTCVALLLPTAALAADRANQPLHRIGTLACKILPHSGINLLIHSTREVECTFAPIKSSGPTEHYKGETGIGLGFDIAVRRSSTQTYSVLASNFQAGTHQLAGRYSGAGGNANIGLSVGQAAPIRKDGGGISLQPMGSENEGLGVAAGFTYLYLQASDH